VRARLIDTRALGAVPATAAAATPLQVLAGPALPQSLAANELWAAVYLPGLAAPQVLEQLALGMQRFTPRVSLEPPDGLLLEVKGSLHLFAGLAGLRAELTRECQQRGLAMVLAFAPIPRAALTVARAGKSLEITERSQLISQLAPLPLAALRWPAQTCGRLARVGVRTIGALLRLPRTGFARRFGAAELAMLDELTGRAAQVRTTFRPRERFRRRREFLCEIENHTLLHAALSPLFDALDSFLTARQCGVVELECRLLHRHAPPTRCVLALASPCMSGLRLAELLKAHLEVITLPEPVRACELRADTPLPQPLSSHGLWQSGEHGGESAAQAGELIERLRARLGGDAVHGLAVRAGHRPECTWALTGPPPLASARRDSLKQMSVAPVHRPLWILSAPQPLKERDGLPRRGGPLQLLGEPERIETGWWDENEITRDYYQALDIHGVRLWVFRERTAPHGWFLHGVFG
jgi:protein ImuB